jgi:hypothetical protein
MNEATLEAKINGELQKLFPSLGRIDLTHQLNFTLKLGRNTIEVDSKERYSKAILDILVSYKGKPLCILELKNPNEELTEDDRDQGISYARLLTPMPPFVVITNGKESNFYRTVDKQKWEISTVDEEKLQELISYGVSLAEKDMDEAVCFLLGRDDDVWVKVIEGITKEHIELLQGEVGDFGRPVIKDFSIQREITAQIEKDLVDGQKQIVLTGPPLSGKTNVFAQLCISNKSKGLIYLYLNMANIGYGPLQFLCNRFSRNLFLKKTADDVRGWLIHSLRSPSDYRLVLIVDNWYEITEESMLQEINELLDISSNSNIAIILGMTDTGFALSKSCPGRTESTVIGKCKRHCLGYLNDSEFYSANEFFRQKYSACFEKGSEYSLLYRLPQTLRIISSKFQDESSVSADKVRLIDSIPGYWLLDIVWRQTDGNIRLQSDMLNYANALLEMNYNTNKPWLVLFKYGWGGMELDKAENCLGASRCQRLEKQGHFKIIRSDGDILVMPTCPELVSGAAVEIISAGLQKYSINDIQEMYNYLISKSDLLPYGELVGVAALLRYSSIEPNGFSNIITKLYSDKPRSEQPQKGKYEVYFPETGRIRLGCEDKMEGRLCANITPWLILSHLAGLQLVDSEGDRTFHLNILANIGSYRYILWKPNPVPLYKMLPISVHEIGKTGEILCHKVGIVEPIVSAMKNCFFFMPLEMIELCKHSRDTQNIFLANRLTQAAENLKMSVNSDISDAAEQALKITLPVILGVCPSN